MRNSNFIHAFRFRMAAFIRRSSVFTCQVIQKCTSRNISQTLQSIPKQKLKQPFQLSMSRNVWHLSRSNVSPHFSEKCKCCGIHTEGDVEFSKFLASEIAIEKENQAPVIPELKGWKIERDGADITLSKTGDGETLRILFNVNNSVDEDEDDNPQQDKVNMVSKPPFTVEIKKSSGKVLSLHCAFSGMDGMEVPEGEAHEDLFNIEEVAIHNGDWKDSTFCVSSDTMDGTLYDMLMDMLHDRGIGDQFVKELTEFSTSYEQGKYVEFLEQMKSFIEEK